MKGPGGDDPERCPATLGAHEQCPTPESAAGWHCGWCGALLSQGRWYPPEFPGSGILAGLGGRLDLGLDPPEEGANDHGLDP